MKDLLHLENTYKNAPEHERPDIAGQLAQGWYHLATAETDRNLKHLYNLLAEKNHQLAISPQSKNPITTYHWGRLVDRFYQEQIRFRRNIRSFCLVLMDITNWADLIAELSAEDKATLAGTITQKMAKGLRTQDILALREPGLYAMLLPETELDGGKILSEKLATRLTAPPIEFAGHTAALELRFGVGVYSHEMNLEDVLQKATNALERAERENAKIGVTQEFMFTSDSRVWR